MREHNPTRLFRQTLFLILDRIEPAAMTGTRPVLETSLSGLQLLRRGKVRDVYGVTDNELLIVATDRISAFDCILPTAIERKGAVLTQLSAFWFEKVTGVTANHLITADTNEMPAEINAAPELRGRSMLVKKTK